MKISIYIAVSANGFISNSKNDPYWLSSEYGAGFASICQRTKAVIMGKTTYNILAPDYLPLTDEGTTVVLTSDKHAKSDNPTVVFTQDTAKDILQMLTEKGHTEAVIIGGTTVMSNFIQAELVDDIYFVMEPFLFGNGLPLLKGVDGELKLDLIEVKKLNRNTVQLHYAIAKPS
ncbi:dihydrofolate reductase family protein [Olivibacter sp. CPCC 100613]|uniref:dihydrofolate reductase family protein n=1 Tax=Olivibacter sp. CPCC 100613 TaxID=3079931 RepID=UPI002FF9FBF5